MTVRDLIQNLISETDLDDEIKVLDENHKLAPFIFYYDETQDGYKGIVIEPVHPFPMLKPENH